MSAAVGDGQITRWLADNIGGMKPSDCQASWRDGRAVQCHAPGAAVAVDVGGS